MTATQASSSPPSAPPSALAAASALDVVGGGRGRRRLWWALGLVLLLALGAWWWLRAGQAGPRIHYQTTPAALGKLVVTVSATGNLQPTNQVTVGSELSGTVDRVLVDVNDRVKKGQVLAELDTAKLEDAVAKSAAALTQAQAQVQQARATTVESRASLARLQEVHKLSGGQVPAATEMATAEATLARSQAAEASAVAAVAQAQATLRSDRTNVSKAQIRSPIDGVVLTRQIEPGATVAASLQAPTLFTLAENLGQMKLQVNVDEADVGQVKDGQSAMFSVDAYADRRYPAVIRRVGLGATTTNNVVSYLTELSVDNADLSLRPGMTATADITTVSREGVLLVPNAALRWSPPAPPGDGAASGAGSGGRSSLVSALLPRPPGGRARPAAATPAARRSGQQQLWVLGADGQPQPVVVHVGASDGRQTEVTGGELRVGQAVVTDSTEVVR